jgi:hypothetical protein
VAEPDHGAERAVTAARRLLVASGVLVMGYALAGALTDPDVQPLGVLVFLIGVLAAHDAVLLPLAIGAGALIGRFVPAPDRATVSAAGLCSLAVAVVALPLVLGYGRVADDPSVLPLPYGRGLAVVLGVVWAVALAAIVVRRIRNRSERSSTAPAPPVDG